MGIPVDLSTVPSFHCSLRGQEEAASTSGCDFWGKRGGHISALKSKSVACPQSTTH